MSETEVVDRVILVSGYFEYFCNNCFQLRLCCDDLTRAKCGNCGSRDIVKGAIGTLDKSLFVIRAEGGG